MKIIKGAFVGSFILGAVLLLLPAFVGAGPAVVAVNCTNSTTIASKLTAAAASASRTLFVTGTCHENVTVRNLRVILDGQHKATIVALDPSKAAVTFTGGTTDATIQGFTIESGANDPTSLDNNGDPQKGGDAITVQNAAVVVVSDNIINVNGCGNGVRVRQQAIATVNKNTIGGNTINDSVGAVSCKGSTGLSISDTGHMALGGQKGVDDNRNILTGHTTGIKCAGGGVVTGVKKSSTNAGLGSAGGLSNMVLGDNTTNDSGVTAVGGAAAANVASQGTAAAGDGTTGPIATAIVSCFTDL